MIRIKRLTSLTLPLALLTVATHLRSQVIVDPNKPGNSGPIIVGAEKSKPNGSAYPNEGKGHALEYGGCSLSASSAEEMQPQLLRPDAVIRPDQYAAFNNILAGIDRQLQVRPKFFLYNDQGSPNAFATPRVFDPQFRDGTVMFGSQLFDSEILRTGYGTNFTISAILAHEFTHILQFKLHEKLPTKQSELEADYMAGWYMGKIDGLWLGPSSAQALMSFYSKGDYEFNSETHHGTPEERVEAVQTGLKDAHSSLKEAFSHAHAYVEDK